MGQYLRGATGMHMGLTSSVFPTTKRCVLNREVDLYYLDAANRSSVFTCWANCTSWATAVLDFTPFLANHNDLIISWSYLGFGSTFRLQVFGITDHFPRGVLYQFNSSLANSHWLYTSGTWIAGILVQLILRGVESLDDYTALPPAEVSPWGGWST
ncbi:hypothetical protein PTI98_000107 [Pleurotus ostreatus]|nr:hypothetical protein PTI98_000107 [Pleurotus ostreatus]